MPPKKYLTIEEGQAILDAMAASQASIEDMKGSIEDLKGEAAARAVVSTTPEVLDTTNALPTLGKLDCYVYDGNAAVKMSFTSEREAVKAINALRRKVMASGINVVCGDTVTCFRHLTRVVFSAELARKNPLLLKA